MLKHELAQCMTVEQYVRFLRLDAYRTQRAVPLPDGRIESWYEDYEVHRFLELDEELNEPITVTAIPAITDILPEKGA